MKTLADWDKILVDSDDEDDSSKQPSLMSIEEAKECVSNSGNIEIPKKDDQSNSNDAQTAENKTK